MVTQSGRDESLDALLDLDGQILVVDSTGGHWVKFRVKRVAPSPEQPHGLAYSLTLHDEAGARLVGLITHIPCDQHRVRVVGSDGAGIINTDSKTSVPTTTRTPPRCLKISG